MRLLYRVLPTNRYLCLRKIIDSAQCSFCSKEEETISHLLWSCDCVRHFWDELQNLFFVKCPNTVNLQLSEEFILFGVKENVYTDVVLDFIILLAKYYIYICKWNNTKPSAHGFQHLLKQRYNIENFYSIVNENKNLFDQVWLPYLDLII